MHSYRNAIAISAVTFALVFFGLVFQFNAANNAVAVFQTQGINSIESAQAIQKTIESNGGVSSVRIDPSRGMILAVFDARSVDPRSIAASLSRKGFQTQINDLMTIQEYNKITGSGGCGTGGCGDCSKNK